ncbi:MAG TPA: cyanophycin synthetase, partial [Rubrobacter sp.]|nr:cyanophycin synthetase [Rubrobacter sp.]
LCYVTMNPRHLLVREHIRAGARAVVLEDGLNGQQIVLYDNGRHIPLLWTHLIPATMEGRALHNVQNAMFATAITLAMGIGLENIRQGLRTFTTDFFQTPGRMNFFNEHPFRVLLDYAHNAHGMRAMAQMIRELTVHGRRIGVVSAPGDRRDADIVELAQAAASAFDLILLREDDNRRGREPGEIGKLLRQGLLTAGVPPERIAPGIYDEEEAVQRGLETAQPGDLLVIFGDKLERSWRQIISFGRSEAPMGDVPVAPIFLSDDELPPPRSILATGAPAQTPEDGRVGEHDD